MAVCQTCGTANAEGAVACVQCRSLLPSGLSPASPGVAPGEAVSPGPAAPAPGGTVVPPPGPPPPGGPAPGRKRGVPILVLVMAIVVAGVAGTAVGAFVLGEVRSELVEARTNALVKAIEGTWDCDVEPGGDWTVAISRTGAARITVNDDEGISNDVTSTITWSIEDDELVVGVGTGATFDDVPDALEDAVISGGIYEDDPSEITVDVQSPTQVDLTWSSFTASCAKTSDEVPNLPRGLREDGD